jgi:hypothetical protein
MRKPKKQQKPLNDLSRSLTPFDPNHTLIGASRKGAVSQWETVPPGKGRSSR